MSTRRRPIRRRTSPRPSTARYRACASVGSTRPPRPSRHASSSSRIAGAGLDEAGRASLEEDLRSPCTEESPCSGRSRARSRTGEDELVVVDMAPTGHTLLLLDATETYHREASRGTGDAPDAASRLAATAPSELHARADPDAARRDARSRGHAPRRRPAPRRHPAVRVDRQPELRCARTFDPVLSARAATSCRSSTRSSA